MTDERLSMDVAELASRNGANLLACQLQHELREKVRSATSHADEIRTLKATINEAQRIGVKVMQAAASGRKTIRIADLVTKDTP